MLMSMNALFYVASTIPLGDSGVTSSSVLFIPQWEDMGDAPNDVVCFVGGASKLEPNIYSVNGGGGANCTAANGCGVHVHAGFDCDGKEAQGGHWYNSEVLEMDPWTFIGYKKTDTKGMGQFASCVRTGFDVAGNPDLLNGRAFIVHADDGSRVSCGVISEAPEDYEPTLFTADTIPIPGTEEIGNSTSVGNVAVMANLLEDVPDGVCYMGYAMGLEPDVESFLLGKGSEQCDVANGCGAHIHAGTGCENSDAQGGHYYDKTRLEADPWKLESYLTTDSLGDTALIGCAITGIGASEYDSRPFIIHKADGSRLLCGLLEAEPADEGIGGDDEGKAVDESGGDDEGEEVDESGGDDEGKEVDESGGDDEGEVVDEIGGDDEREEVDESGGDDEGEEVDENGGDEGDEYENCTTGDEDINMSLQDIACTHCDALEEYCSMCDLFKKCDPTRTRSIGLYTAFFPTDQAFARLLPFPDYVTDDIICDVFDFHFHEGEGLEVGDLVCTGKIEMTNGRNSRTKCINGTKYQKGSYNKETNTLAEILEERSLTGCNGEIMTIDHVLLP